jgi:hypothetical protein
MTEHQVVDVGDVPDRLGSRISARFGVVGFHEEISEQRRQPVRPAEFDDQ